MKSIIRNYSILALSFTLIFSSACKLDDTTITGVPQLEYTTVNQLADVIGADPQSFSVNANEDQEITGANGIKLTIPQDIFRNSNGEIVNGMVDLQFKEILTKSEMVLSNKPSETNSTLLESVGTFQLKASQNGEGLNINQPIGVELNANTSISDPTALGVYYGNETAGVGSFVNWVLDSNSQVPLNAGIHAIDANQLAWISCAKPLESPETFKISVSPGSLTNLNDQQGFIIFDDTNTVAALRPEGSLFVRDDYPGGKTCSVVMIAMDPINLYLSVVSGVNLDQDRTVNANYIVVTEEELISTIEQLN